MSSLVRLRLLPSAQCLYTQPVRVLVDGLRTSQVVTVKAKATDDKGVPFHASAIYRADAGGAVDLGREPSLGGSYTGVEPMGLLWSLRADALHTKFCKSDSRRPHVVRFSVHDGEAGTGPLLAEATNERRLLADGVERQPIKEGNIRGVLFVPPGRNYPPPEGGACLTRRNRPPHTERFYASVESMPSLARSCRTTSSHVFSGLPVLLSWAFHTAAKSEPVPG